MHRALFDLAAQPQQVSSSTDATAWNLPTVPAAQEDFIKARHVPGAINKTVLTFAALSVIMTDAGVAGSHGSKQLLDFPVGSIAFIGATCDLTTTAGSGGITDTAPLVGSVGTAAAGTADATLTGTEADIVPSTDGTLAAGAGTIDGTSVTAGIAVFDGRTTAKDMFLNLAVADAGSTANDTVEVSGTITIFWAFLGDN